MATEQQNQTPPIQVPRGEGDKQKTIPFVEKKIVRGSKNKGQIYFAPEVKKLPWEDVVAWFGQDTILEWLQQRANSISQTWFKDEIYPDEEAGETEPKPFDDNARSRFIKAMGDLSTASGVENLEELEAEQKELVDELTSKIGDLQSVDLASPEGMKVMAELGELKAKVLKIGQAVEERKAKFAKRGEALKKAWAERKAKAAAEGNSNTPATEPVTA